jgi:amidase
MNRREFLRTTTAGTLALAETACTPKGSAAASAFDLDEFTIATLQGAINSGRHTARSICEQYLARIAAIDKTGPAINAIIELNPDALLIADALDRERKANHVRSPLHGIPVLLKDNIDTAGRMMTTAGSLALEGNIAQQDSTVAQRLRAAGAIILGKTNLSEWANFRSTHSSSGWSGRGGQTRNPYVLDRNPCGSSSGSAAATSANLCAFAIGTETDGSIVCPSAVNGIVGIKPTLGLVSRAGIIPIAHSQDTAGPMARTVTDAAIVLGALVGPDSRDAATQTSTGKSFIDYTRFLDPRGLRGARIGVARKFFGYQREVDLLMDECLAAMKQAGAEIIDPADLPSHDQYRDSEFTVLLYEFKADLNAYLGALGPSARVHSLKDVIAFNNFAPTKEMPHFGQEIMLLAEAKGPLTEQAYLDALARNHQLARDQGIDAALQQFKLDAIVAPAGGPAWLTDLVTGDHDIGGSSTPAAVAGYPNISVPAGFVHGLPVGISFFAGAYSEPTLLKLAYSFEQTTRFRRPPQFRPSAEL